MEVGTVKVHISHICNLIPTFLGNCYVKRHKAEKYKKSNSIPTTLEKALILVDFAENYTCSYQSEIQSAHWQQSQVSLFTAAIWHSGTHKPLVLAFDNTVHSNETVVAYVDEILQCLPRDLMEVSIWSDGPSPQFKNRFIAAALCALHKKKNFIKNGISLPLHMAKAQCMGLGHLAILMFNACRT